MGSHPINLTIRFLLELTALIVFGYWGWGVSDGWFRFVLVIGVPVIAAALWGIFAVPNDPSRSGKTPIPTSGLLRLFMEFSFFGLAAWALFDFEYTSLGWTYCTIVVIHYCLSYDRIIWLIKR